MHLGDRHHPAGRVGEGDLDLCVLGRRALQLQERRDQLQRIADTMIDFAQQHGPFDRQLLEAIALLAQFLFRGFMGAPQPHRFGGACQRGKQQRHELSGCILENVIESAGLEGGDCHARNPAHL